MIFDAFEIAAGECRRTFLVRFFTVILPVRSRCRWSDFQGGRELTGKAPGGGFVTALLVY
jgi:hypothetical protein